MKKICVFTQTYSDNRIELFKYHNKDIKDIDFRNSFDLNLYSFHNSSPDYIKKVQQYPYFNNFKNLNFLYYNNISYPETFRLSIYEILKRGYNYIIFLQDDCFTTNNSDVNSLIEFLYYGNFNMLNLETYGKKLSNELEINYKKDNFEVYNSNTEHFKKIGLWAFDDGAYCANIDFILSEIYDERYFSYKNIWEAERYLNEKIKNLRTPLERLTTNLNLYERFNIVGPNNWNKQEYINRLNEL